MCNAYHALTQLIGAKINQTGTYWWHCHYGGQMPDGLRGPLIVHDPNSPYAGQYDDELVLTFSDWYHDQMPGLLSYYLSPERNPSGAEPVPYSALFNEVQNASLRVEPDKTYLVRIISMAAFAQVSEIRGQNTARPTYLPLSGIYMVRSTFDDHRRSRRHLYPTARGRLNLHCNSTEIRSPPKDKK